jgi:hypothetical protein
MPLLVVRSTLLACALTALAGASQAGVIAFTDRNAFLQAAGAVHAITFADLTDETVLGNQYLSLGIQFGDGTPDTVLANGSFLDGKGYFDNGDSLISFSAPIYHFAVDFPGAQEMRLSYVDGSEETLQFGDSGLDLFGGVVSAGLGITRISLRDFVDSLGFVDTIYLKAVPPQLVPLPSTAALAGLGLLALTGKRRGKRG